LEAPESRWFRLVAQVRAADADAAEEWITSQSQGVRLLLRRRLGTAASPELARSILTDSITEVRAGRIASPRQLLEWLRRVARRYASDDSAPATTFDSRVTTQQTSRLAEALRGSEPRSREAMRRFYLEGEPADRIAAELGYSFDEFLQLRSNLRLAVSPVLPRKPADSATDARKRAAGSG
jgi:hypothetical protein